MSLWHTLRHGLRALVRRDAAHHELDEEVRHYLEEAAAELQSRGMSKQQALRTVRLELGGSTQVYEQVRGYGWENAVEAVLIDLRYALRRLRGAPIFTAVSVITIAVGIGATTVVFSAVDSILLRPLPYPEAQRIVSVWDVDAEGSRVEETYGTYVELRARSRGFAELAVSKPWLPTLRGNDEPERLAGQRVSASYFRLLGIRPALGQVFEEGDDRPGSPARVILSDRLWRRHFGADPGVIGRPIELDERSFEVVAVMLPEFQDLIFPSATLWSTLQYDMSQGRAWGHHLRLTGRLGPNVELTDAENELNHIAATPSESFVRPSWASLEHGLILHPLQHDLTRGVRSSLLALLGAAGLVLTIAGLNVSLLLLARGARQRDELALRTALGAGHGRLVRQQLAECLLLALIGGLAGLFLAWFGVRLLLVLAPRDLPRLEHLSLHGSTLTIGLGLAAVVALIFGLLPALQSARNGSRRTMRLGSHRHTTEQRRVRRFLVVAEVAMATVLLVCSGLLLRSLQHLLAVDLGFEPDSVLSLQVQVSGDRYGNQETERFYAHVLERVRSIPGVDAAAFTSQLPLSGDQDVYGIGLSGVGRALEETETSAFRYTVSPGYIAAMDIPVLRGRDLNAGDRDGSARVALISEAVARKRLLGIDPIGQQLRIGPPDRPPYTIVGVVGDVRQVSLGVNDAEAVYIPSSQWHFADDARSLVVRASIGNRQLLPALRRAIWSVDRHRPIVRVAAMEDLVDASVAQRRFTLILFELFALASLILAAAGLYGVLAGAVAERRRELGVRAAMGASRPVLLTMVLRQGLALAGLGLVLGAFGAVAASRGLSSLLFAVSNFDPTTYVSVSLLLCAIAALACFLPAMRAARVDPATVLRSD